MNKSYDFVPFLKCETYECKGKLYEGIITITIKTLTPIHISPGKYSVDENKKIFKPFIKINGRMVIPGTSLKGVVRSVAEAVSYSCYTLSNKLDKKKLLDKSHKGKRKCIICDMFGSMGYKSKVQFSDCYLINGESEIIGLPASFSPNPQSSAYFDEKGKYKGHKFYKHGILGIQRKGDILYECVRQNAEFKGEVRFKALTEEQIELLCFSLGLSGDIQPKIGFGKNYFYGSISIESEERWTDKAKEYKNNKDANISKNISNIIEILSFNNAVKSLE